MGRIWRYSISDGVPRRSLIVALIVGTILNLINQGDAMIAELPLDITKLLLTYLVPYCVSTYGAVSCGPAGVCRAGVGAGPIGCGEEENRV